MAFFSGAVNLFPGLLPQVSAATQGALLTNDGTSAFWAYPGASGSNIASGFQYRSILTHGYVAAGYKDSGVWRTVNKTWHATDITFSCGDQLDQAGNYIGGTFSDYYGYVHGTGGGNAVSGGTAATHTSSYNLHTGISRSVFKTAAGGQSAVAFGYTGNNPAAVTNFPYGDGGGSSVAANSSFTASGTGTWELSVGRTLFGALVDQINQVGYIAGGPQSSVTDKFHMPTEIMYVTTSTGMTNSHTAAGGGQNIGWWNFGGTGKSLTFSNDSYASWAPSTVVSPDGVCKILTTKLGFHYSGTGSNNTNGMQKYSDATGATQTTFTKPASYGEENFQMGQNWGYCLGAYNGLQNNYSAKHNYSNDSVTALGTASQPKGHVGMSSGVCSSAAASVTASYT